MTLHLNKRHVLFQVERCQEGLKTIFVVTAKEKSKAELKQTFLERTKRRFGKFVFSFRWNRPIFFGRFGRKPSKQLHTIRNDEDHVSEKNQKLFLYVFGIARHLKRSMWRAKLPNVAFGEKKRSQNVTLQMNKKHVLFQVERPQEVLKTYFLVATNEKSKAELKQTFLERTKRHFAKSVFSFPKDRPLLFGRFVRKSSKQLHTIQNDEDHVSEKIKSCFFLSIRYRKTSQTQDVKSQSTKRSVRKLAQPKRDSAFEQETRFVSSGEIWGSSQKSFFSYNQSNKPTRAQKKFGTYSRSFWKFSVSLKKQELFL